MSTLTAADAATLKSINPATGEVVGEGPGATEREIEAAVARARTAQPAWRALGARERAESIRPLGVKLVQRADELGEMLTREMGKPLSEAVGEVKHCGSKLDDTLREIVEALEPDRIEADDAESTIYYDPFGVCAAITPWNFPLAMPHWAVIPALTAGNTVVLKPSEETPLVAQAYVDLLNESLPGDVLQIVHGADGPGKALVQANVDLIVFTGSRAAGRHILGAASDGLKRVILELGGKDPMIVLDDADVTQAAQFAVRNSFRNAGQVCVSTERIYVDQAIADRFEAQVIRLTGEQNVGDGTQPGVTIGPMINSRQRDHVLAQIDDAIQHGATVIAGGEGHHDGFVMPTVLAGVTQDMARFRDFDEAVALANDTPYGLGAAIFGGDLGKAAEVARRLDAGMIGINKGCGGAEGSPWVGAKQSGYGYHSGKAGHRQFTQPRVVSVPKQK